MKVIKVTGNLSISCHRWVPTRSFGCRAFVNIKELKSRPGARQGGPGHADHSCLTLADLEPRLCLFPGSPLSGWGGGGGPLPRDQDPGEDIPAPQHPVPKRSLHLVP